MAQHHVTGKKGEAMALEHLRREGFDIITTNWRQGHLEIDIIAKEGNQLVIVEVKTRHSDQWGEPETTVDKKKQRFLSLAANEYIHQIDYMGETRFDIIGILFTPQGPQLVHVRDAFFPGLF
jgi:putative endonuclease